MNVTFTYNDVLYEDFDPEEALERGVPEVVIEKAVADAQNAAGRIGVRKAITASAGDQMSMLGTTADAAAIATLGIAAMTVAMASSNDYAKFKTAFLGALGKLAGDKDMVAISADLLAKIESGEVIIPAMAKGMDAVIADIEQRSTAVSQALIAAKAG
jgi:hypothetical protein